MALPILDGNQTAATLSTIITGGAHIPAHTVVSLGSQAISDISNAVSSVQVSGTVTANAGGDFANSIENVNDVGNVSKKIAVQLYDDNGGAVGVPNNPLPISGTVTANVDVGSRIRILDSNGDDIIVNPINGAFDANVKNSITIGSLPEISGTVTANGGDFASNNTAQPASAIQLGFQNLGGDFVSVNQDGASFPIRLNEVEGSIVVPISGTVTANVGIVNDSNFVYNSDKIMVAGGVEYLSPDGRGGAIAIDSNNAVIVSSVTIGSLPNIVGTVTANGGDFVGIDGGGNTEKSVAIGYWDDNNLEFRQVKSLTDQLPVKIHTSDGVVGDGNSSIPISGTVTANLNDPTSAVIANQIGDALFASDQLTNNLNSFLALQNNVPISGTVTANMFGFDCVNNEYSPIPVLPYNEPIDCGNTVIARLTDTSGTDLNLANGVPISGTVTANNPSGALTTRFGSVATANLAFITSAVTNTSRKYLLAQNISAGTVTIGIGFSPTTTQGIQLTAGGGLTFDAFCPTGAVYWLGAVTGAAFTILEG